MQITVTFKGKFNPKQVEEVKKLVARTSVGTKASVKSSSDEISISIDSDIRQYLRPAMPSIVKLLNARKMFQTDPSGTQKPVGASQLLG